MRSNTDKPVCVIVGVGPGNGEALARTFADAGHAVARLPDARAFACDATDAAAVERTFAQIAKDMGDVATLIHNAGKGVRGAVDQVSQDDFEQAWRINALGLFLAARQVIPTMKARGAGNLIVIGATASRRGVAGTAAFAPAKMAQRALTESMARHLGPSGIHVSLLILDGAIGGPEARARFRDRPDDAFIAPDAIASTALQLTLQDRSAWSFEVDLRPFNETW
jgi:NAD(P)-dependent dehydrogenase (short-subunit alcohol dehydrogenase family)